MADQLRHIKAVIVTIISALSAVFGWFGWVVIIWIALMMIDWLTGTLAAHNNGTWESSKGRAGIWHKFGCFIVVITAGLLDIIIGLLIDRIPNIGFNYSVAISLVVIIWYILTEMGSIIENAGKLGAPIPNFLAKGIKVLKHKVITFGDSMTGEIDNAKGNNGTEKNAK